MRQKRDKRWRNPTPAQKASKVARQFKYQRTEKGRAINLRQAYKKIDECDMTTAEVLAIIRQPCTYCGTIESPRGLDRIDNAKPHIRSNVCPCCAPCNFARGNRFTQQEMLLIGAVIKKIMTARNHAG